MSEPTNDELVPFTSNFITICSPTAVDTSTSVFVSLLLIHGAFTFIHVYFINLVLHDNPK